MHTPNPGLRRQSGVSDSSFSNSSSPRAERKLGIDNRKDEMNLDDSRSSSSSTPSIFISQIDGHNNLQSGSTSSIMVPPAIQINVLELADSSPTVSPVPSPGKVKPPPLHIVDSNFARFKTPDPAPPSVHIPPALPLLCISSPPPESTDSESETTVCIVETASKTEDKDTAKSISSSSSFNWKQINIGSPPIRKNKAIDTGLSEKMSRDDGKPEAGFRRALKDTFDKSSSLDLPHPPPMITITTNFCSEIESDTDSVILGKFT